MYILFCFLSLDKKQGNASGLCKYNNIMVTIILSIYWLFRRIATYIILFLKHMHTYIHIYTHKISNGSTIFSVIYVINYIASSLHIYCGLSGSYMGFIYIDMTLLLWSPPQNLYHHALYSHFCTECPRIELRVGRILFYNKQK